jgi:hypothetical protein
VPGVVEGGGKEEGEKDEKGKGVDAYDDDRRDDGGTPFDDFVPAFFHALAHYFPSEAGGDGRRDANDENDDDRAPTTTTTTTSYSYSSPSGQRRSLPPPRSTTLVLRTFGTDLHRVANCVTEFARGRHPKFPNYRNRDLIFGEGDIMSGRWTRAVETGRRRRTNGKNEDGYEYGEGGDETKEGGGEGGGTLVYELHHQSDDDVCHRRCLGDDEILDYLESRTVVGIRDDYEFWRDNNQAPWSGKPVWSRRMAGGTSRGGEHDACGGGGDGGGGSMEVIGGGGDGGNRRRRRRRPMRHDHHHILLDDNIHNDPNDGIGAVRAPILVEETNEFDHDDCGEDDFGTRMTTTTISTTHSTASYVSLRGSDLLEMHGKHLIRVPTLRPLLEDDWFVRRIEDARLRIYLEEEKEEKREEADGSQEKIINRKVT